VHLKTAKEMQVTKTCYPGAELLISTLNLFDTFLGRSTKTQATTPIRSNFLVDALSVSYLVNN